MAITGTTLQTARLRIRRMTAADAPFMLQLLNEPSYHRFIGDRGVRTVEEAERYILGGPVESHRVHGFGMDVVEERATGVPVGICGILKRAALDSPDLGYALLPEHWSRGYAREAAEAVLRHASGELGLARILAITDPENPGSIRLLQRLGFRREGWIRLPGESIDLHLFGWSPPAAPTMANTPSTLREYEVHAATAPVFGRVLSSARQHHFVVDGPVQNGCPGEAVTPAELFLSGVACCGAELMQVIARDEGIPFLHVSISVQGTVDRESQPRSDVTVFNRVHLRIRLRGPSEAQAALLVAGFQRRCPLYGSVAVASQQVQVDFTTEPA